MASPTPKPGDKPAEKTDKAPEKAEKSGKPAEKAPEKGGKPAEKAGEAGATGAKDGGAPPPRAPKAKRGKRVDAKGVVHVKASFNNTLVTITTGRGEVISVGSAGTVGFKGTRKSTPFAAQRAAEQAAATAMRHGLREELVDRDAIAAHKERALRSEGRRERSDAGMG